MTTIEIGNIGSKEQAQKLVSKLQGQTYMNFIVQYGKYAGNYPVTVLTERPETTEEELREMLLFYMACEF
jgi:CHASE3 domain sensor protein